MDDKTKYTDWDNREEIKAELKVELIMLLAEIGYAWIDRDHFCACFQFVVGTLLLPVQYLLLNQNLISVH